MSAETQSSVGWHEPTSMSADTRPHLVAYSAGIFWRGRERVHYFDQESAILDSNSEEAWGEMKLCPREWELGRKEK